MNQLNNKVAIITGAANGLGKALAEELNIQGYNLALVDIDAENLHLLKTKLQNVNTIISSHTLDISKEENVALLLNQVLSQHNRVDMLFNNAGVSISLPFEQLRLEDYKWLFEINFWGSINCSKYFLPILKKSPNGRLVNIISGFALSGFPGKTSYASSKSAILGFSNSLKLEVSELNIKICVVIPPALDTEIVKRGLHISESKKTREISYLKKNSVQTNIVARKIINQVKKGKYRIVIGKKAWLLDFLSRVFPSLSLEIINRYKNKFDFI